MSEDAAARAGKPRPYVRPIPWTWWLKRPAYTKFMVRELSSAAIAAYALFLLVLVCSARDVASFHGVYEALRSPASVVLHVVVLAFSLFHTVTFFNLTPRAIVVRVGEDKVPDDVIRWAHYFGWALVSAALLFLVTRG